MTTSIRIKQVNRVTVRPDVMELSTVRIKAVGPQGASGSSAGDMTKAVYDPTTVAGDAFNMSNMVETAGSKILTAAERSKLAGIQAGAQVNHSAAEIKTRYESNANTNAYTDAEQLKLAAIEENADVTADNETSHADVLVDADIGVTVSASGHDHSGVYEPVFAKNSGFNKNLGSVAGTVAEGDHAHTGEYEPIDSTILREIDVGDTIAAEDHTHTESEISDLRAYLVSSQVTYELLDTNGDVGMAAGKLAPGDHTHTRMTVFVEDMDSEIAPIGYIPTSNGLGEVGWQPQTGGIPASSTEVDAGTDDVKFPTSKTLKDAHNVPHVAPGTSGNVLTSDGTDWTSAAISSVSEGDVISLIIALG